MQVRSGGCDLPVAIHEDMPAHVWVALLGCGARLGHDLLLLHEDVGISRLVACLRACLSFLKSDGASRLDLAIRLGLPRLLVHHCLR